MGKQIKDYVSGKTHCTLPEYTSNLDIFPEPNFGQVLSKDNQCKLRYQDKRSFFCKELQKQVGFERLCGGMYCDIPFDHEGSCASILPQEYTPCGEATHAKWCIKGECVDVFTNTDDDLSTITGPTMTVLSPTVLTKLAPQV